MAEYSKAFVIGGFSEGEKFLKGFTNAVSQGPGRIVEDADFLSYAYARKHADKLAKEARRRIVFEHSLGTSTVKEAGIVVAMNGAEPIERMRDTVGRAWKVFNNHDIKREEQVKHPSRLSGPWEVTKHPGTLGVLSRLKNFSTLQMLIDGGTEAFPDGRFYLPTIDDEFGFGHNGEVELARTHGITAEMLPGWHNQPLLHPVKAVEQISAILNATN